MIKVLVCEDDEMVLKMVEFKLQKEGYEVFLAYDGKEAVEKIRSIEPDIIITDIMMPNLSGLNLLTLLRTFYFNNTPVILVSSLDDSHFITRALGMGAENFLGKPIDLSLLSSKIKMLMGANAA